MATVWTLASTKGGCGKTTLAAVITSEVVRLGGTVTLIETDANRPLSHWAAKGGLPDNVTVLDAAETSGRVLTEALQRLKSTRQFVVIDTEGTRNILSGLAIQHADVVVIPMKWSELDKTEALKVDDFVRVASQAVGRIIPSVIVPSQVEAVIETKSMRDIRTELDGLGNIWIDPPVLNKDAYRRIFTEGRLLHDLPQAGSANAFRNALDNAHAVVQAIGRAAVAIKKSSASKASA